MAGDAVLVLVNVLAKTGLIAHRWQMRRIGATGVDGCRVNDKGNAKRAEKASFVDGAVLPGDRRTSAGSLRDHCTQSTPEQGLKGSEKIGKNRLLFDEMA